jgi:hypothetical protein
MPRNELADLRENRDPRFGWFLLNHQADPMWDRPPATPLFFHSYGMAVCEICRLFPVMITVANELKII